MIATSIVNVIDWLPVAHNQLTTWETPTTILYQVSRSKSITDQVKCKLKTNNRRPFFTTSLLPIVEIDATFEIVARLYNASQNLH